MFYMVMKSVEVGEEEVQIVVVENYVVHLEMKQQMEVALSLVVRHLLFLHL
jgi:hypothetical protein